MLRRALITMTFAAVAVLVPVAPAQAVAYCGYTAWCTSNYYSSAAKTLLVGSKTIHCGGSVSQWGVTTQYQTQSEGLCDL